MLRLSQEQAEALEAVAQTDGVPMAQTVRSAIAAHIEQRRQDKDFQRPPSSVRTWCATIPCRTATSAPPTCATSSSSSGMDKCI